MGRRRNGEGSIYRRRDGRWQGAITLGGGVRKNVYGVTASDVREKLAKIERERDMGLIVPTTTLTVRQYLRQWLDDIARPSIRPSTYRSYEDDLQRLDGHIGHLKLGDLKPAALQATYGRLLRRGLSERSVERVHTVLHRALRQAVQFELIGRNPADVVSPPRPQRKEMRTLNADEVRVLFTTTEGHRFHPIWVLLVTSGMRVGEALGLQWQDVDLEIGRLQVRRALQRQQGVGFVFIEPKTRRSRRTIYIPAGSIAALRAHRVRQLEEQLEAGEAWENKHGLVFTTPIGRPIESGLVNWNLKRALEKAGLPQVRVHDLRHTAASLLLERGVHPKVVQEMLGHSTINLTLDTYSHVTPSLQRATASELQPLFESGAFRSDDRSDGMER